MCTSERKTRAWGRSGSRISRACGLGRGARGGKKPPPRHPRPECVLPSEKLERGGEAEVEYRELVGCGGHRRDMAPAAGYLAQDHRKTEDRSEHVEVHLN